jgi:hypothetical protein
MPPFQKGQTALMLAAQKAIGPKVGYLVEQGADLSIRDAVRGQSQRTNGVHVRCG